MNASIKPAVVRTETIELAPELVAVTMTREQATLLRAITAWPVTIMATLTNTGVIPTAKTAVGQTVLADLAAALDVVVR